MTFQPPKAIARICQVNHNVVGAGFLVSEQHILTCAHVVNGALGRRLETTDEPSQEVCLDFPLVAPGKILKGRVIRWIPFQPSSSILPETGADIALLELESLPTERIPAIRLIMADNLWKHPFRVFGFPKGQPVGVYTDGIIREKQGNGRVQIEVKNAAYRIEQGFSGSPVWDEELDGVAGMTVTIDPGRPNDGAAFIIPTIQLINACPELKEQLDFSLREEKLSLLKFCLEAVEKPGSLLRIKAPWQMGKTELLIKIFNHFKEQNNNVVFLNLRNFDGEGCDNLDKFLRSFCFRITDRLNIQQQVDERWDEFMGTSQLKCSLYFEKYLLAADKPLILLLDEVDKIFSYSHIAGHFLGLLRTWHEEAKLNQTLQKLRVVLAYTETYTKMQINQSPFNAGIEIKLPELTEKQVDNLAQSYGLQWSINKTKSLIKIVGGHPYLVKQAFENFQKLDNISWEISSEYLIESGIYENHFQRYLQYLKQYPNLQQSFQEIILCNHSEKYDFDLSIEQIKQLENLGLIKLQNKKIKPRFQLYQEYFKQYFGV
ncbi:MAG: AAA-like domain-containing protein [Crocosphaera sp.]